MINYYCLQFECYALLENGDFRGETESPFIRVHASGTCIPPALTAVKVE